jgi:hypothetical protein
VGRSFGAQVRLAGLEHAAVFAAAATLEKDAGLGAEMFVHGNEFAGLDADEVSDCADRLGAAFDGDSREAIEGRLLPLIGVVQDGEVRARLLRGDIEKLGDDVRETREAGCFADRSEDALAQDRGRGDEGRERDDFCDALLGCPELAGALRAFAKMLCGSRFVAQGV